MFELHVWGPAFGLPSIDAQCLAALLYLHNTLPSREWSALATNDASISPHNLLPALNHNGQWISGFTSIVRHLIANDVGTNLDSGLGEAQLADCTAWCAFLNVQAQPLLDLSLYVSAANWSSTTRPAYSSLLTFPLTWTVPPLIRGEAIERAAHLGLAELDSDFDPHSGLHLSAGRDALPETFRKHLPPRTKKTIHEEMTPEQAVAIRLFSYVDDALSPLEDLLATAVQNDYHARLMGTKSLTSLDCLAFGYLAIMAKAPVPRPFIRDWLQSKAPRLQIFVQDMLSCSLTEQGPIPWAQVPQKSAVSAMGGIIDSIVRHVPNLSEHYAAELRRRTEAGFAGKDSQTLSANKGTLLLVAGLLITGFAASYGIYSYKHMAPFGARSQVWKSNSGGSRLSEFGALGSMLSSALGPVPSFTDNHGVDISLRGNLVEVDSDVD